MSIDVLQLDVKRGYTYEGQHATNVVLSLITLVEAVTYGDKQFIGPVLKTVVTPSEVVGTLKGLGWEHFLFPGSV
jgi:hypothetical protein